MGTVAKNGDGTPPQRMPLKTLADAKRVLARFTRLMVRGEMDVAQYRAAVYGVSTFINALKADMPGTMLHGTIEVPPPPGTVESAADMTPEDREARMHEIMSRAGYIKAANPPVLETDRTVGTVGGEPLVVTLPEWIVRGEAMQAACEAVKGAEVSGDGPSDARLRSCSAGDGWRPSGIGAKRGTFA